MLEYRPQVRSALANVAPSLLHGAKRCGAAGWVGGCAGEQRVVPTTYAHVTSCRCACLDTRQICSLLLRFY